jgi:UDP-glucuronate decarboxylase
MNSRKYGTESKMITNAHNVVNTDLKYICSKLIIEFTELSGNKVLIAGGAGFLGYYLVQSILFWNDTNKDMLPIDLVVYDNFMRGMPAWLNILNERNDVRVEKHNIIYPLPKDMGDVDYIIHAATIASPTYYRRYPLETMDANVNGLRNILDYCVKHNLENAPVKGILFFSTSEIYGDPSSDNIPTAETYRGNVSCTGPRACYDESKRYGETLCVNYAKQHNVAVKIARPFNNYGPGLKITDRRALPDFARNILNGEDVIMLSDGAPTRTFCYISDAIVGYYKVLVNGKKGESYNIGSDNPEISIRELAERTVKLAKELFNYQGNLIFRVSDDEDYLTDNPNRRCPIIDKARSELDYYPNISIQDGLKRSLIWYSGNME